MSDKSKKEELKGLLKEIVTDQVGPDIDKIKEEAEALKEANAKILEENKELKEQFDSLQEKTVKLTQNTGDNLYVFKGYDAKNPNRNFHAVVDKDIRDAEAEKMVKALTEGNTGAYAVAVEYSNALLGLAELSSVALSKARIYTVGTNSIKMPTKGNRATVDWQAFGTANTDVGNTLGQLSFTIDKRVGGYASIYNDLLADEIFDVVGQFIEPTLAEAIGQAFDSQMFNGTEFTTYVGSSSNGVTASGVSAIANAITYSNLVELMYSVELERGLSPQWFMPRGAMKDIVSLVDSNGRPIFNPVPVSGAPAGTLLGYPINIVPEIDNTPDDGAIRLAFGDAKHYIIALRQGLVFQSNPYVQMKEAITQFVGYARADGNVDAANAWAVLKRDDS